MIQAIHDWHTELCEFCKEDPTACVPGSGPTKTKLVLVGEAPGKEEKYGGEPFIGPAGRLLREMISDAGVPEKKLRFENIVRFWPQDEKGFTRQPTNKEVISCIPYFYETLLTILKNVEDGENLHILAFGNVALESLTGNKKITSNRGIVFPLKVLLQYSHSEDYKILEKRCKVIGAIHPSAVLRGSSNYQPKIVSDISFAWKLANGSIPKYWEEYRWLDDPDDFEAWVDDALKKHSNGEIEWLSYDLETTGLETYDLENHYTVCASFCIEPQKAIVVPLRHKDSPWKDDKFTEQRILKDMQRLLGTIPLCGWNLSFDVKWTWLHLELTIKEIGFDGFLARRWLFQSHGDNDLNSCAAQELGFVGHGNELEAELAALPKDQQHYGNISKDVMVIYAGGDADAALQLGMKYKKQMESANLFEPFKEMMVDGILPVCEMEVDGVYISKDTNDYLIELYPGLMEPHLQLVENSPWGQATSAVLAKRINKDGKAKPLSFNLGSTATMQELLFNQMRLPVVEQGKTGPSTDREVVETLLEWCTVHKELEKKKVLESINELRALKHTYNNFIKNIEEYTKYDGLFHTNYNIGGTDTGRFSSSKPSLHGQPKGSEARWQFISRWRGAGGIIASSDMSQMEVRILASLANDKNLIETISSGVDIHTANASKMFNVPLDKVDKALRDRAKRCSFGVIYGIGAQTLASRIETSVAEAQAIIDAWYEAFPNTFEFQKNEFKIAKKYGYVSTNFGRIRKIDNIEGSKWGDRAWRQTINYQIQCHAFGTKVLTEELNWVPIENLKTGDRLLAFEENPKKLYSKRHWLGTEVISADHDEEECYELVLENGDKVVVTENHLHLTANVAKFTKWTKTKELRSLVDNRERSERTVNRKKYKTISGEQVASRLVKVLSLESSNIEEWERGYVAGMFDADGCFSILNSKTRMFGSSKISDSNTRRLTMSQLINVSLVEVKRILDKAGFKYRDYRQNKKRREDMRILEIQGGQHEIVRFLSTFKPPRLLRKFINKIGKLGQLMSIENPKIVEINCVGKRKIVRLETSSGTYVADGYATHNSSASDVTYLAMRRVKESVKRLGLRSKVFGFVHDSVITDVFPGELWDILDILKESMIDWTNSAFDWMKAPIDADSEIGVAWGYPCGVIDKSGDCIKVEGGEKEILLLDAELSNFHGYEKILLDSTDSGKMHLEFSRELPF